MRALRDEKLRVALPGVGDGNELLERFLLLLLEQKNLAVARIVVGRRQDEVGRTVFAGEPEAIRAFLSLWPYAPHGDEVGADAVVERAARRGELDAGTIVCGPWRTAGQPLGFPLVELIVREDLERSAHADIPETTRHGASIEPRAKLDEVDRRERLHAAEEHGRDTDVEDAHGGEDVGERGDDRLPILGPRSPQRRPGL